MALAPSHAYKLLRIVQKVCLDIDLSGSASSITIAVAQSLVSKTVQIYCFHRPGDEDRNNHGRRSRAPRATSAMVSPRWGWSGDL